MKKIFLSLLLVFIFQTTALGQFKYTFSQFGKETVDFIKQPLKWKATDYVIPAVTIFLTYEIMLNYDEPIRTAVLKDRRYYNSVPIEFGRIWGELYMPVVLFSGLAAHSLLTNNITTRKIAYEIGQASLYAGAITYILKFAIGRSRPYMEEGRTSFHPFGTIFNTENQSLPGGHTTAAFVLSTVISRNVEPTWLKVAVYIPAALTFISRIYQDKHWTSDDFFGAVLGYFVATWVVDQHEDNKSIVEFSSAFPLSIRIPL
ncbi:MAG: phosphatase PAP2 family protein [Ignavibacteria bacterium]|nr:phosphatase PAP2 family protein [Ignavibacteria bacterium]MDP3581397.1 phosphatase PAP2 family protein [Ignavibacteria bacterium]